MAKKGKVDRGKFKAGRKFNHRRPYRTSNPRKYYLIVCEGEKTERNYFEAFKSDLPKGVIAIDVVGAGMNTLSLLNEATRLREKRKKERKAGFVVYEYDEVWIVFDKDDFNQYDLAIIRAEQEQIKCAYSNQAFELWYLLHFDYHDSALHRSQYQEMLSERLGFNYEKNASNIYDALKKNSQADAIRNAKKLYKSYDNISPAQKDPSTKVHELVEQLNTHKKKENQ